MLRNDHLGVPNASFLLFEKQVFVEFFFFFFFFFLQYFMNAALERTSVASTTIVFSTSGLFTLLIGALLGEDYKCNKFGLCFRQHGWCCHDSIWEDLGNG